MTLFSVSAGLEPTRTLWENDQVRKTSLKATVQECNGFKSVYKLKTTNSAEER